MTLFFSDPSVIPHFHINYYSQNELETRFGVYLYLGIISEGMLKAEIRVIDVSVVE